MTISLRIEELVLHGFAPGDRHAIAEGLRTELDRLLTEQGLPSPLAAGADLMHIDADSFDVTPDSRPGALGGQIARSIVGGMNE